MVKKAKVKTNVEAFKYILGESIRIDSGSVLDGILFSSGFYLIYESQGCMNYTFYINGNFEVISEEICSLEELFSTNEKEALSNSQTSFKDYFGDPKEVLIKF